MKNNKKLLGLILGLVCVLICLVLTLTMCNGSNDDPDPTTTADTVATTDAATVETQETTLPGTETTAPTEDTTEPTTGNVKPGGSGSVGGSGGTEDTENKPVEPTEPVWEVGEPGTKENPYIEVVKGLPSTFTTVNVPAKGSTFYHVYGAAGAILTIEDADAVVDCGGKTYRAEHGVVTVPISESASMPLTVLFGNQASAKKAFTVELLEESGKKSNPYQLTLDTLPAAVATPAIKAGDTVYYSISGAANAVLTVADKNVSVIYNETTYLPEDGVVTVVLSEEEPAELAIVNTGSKAASFSLQFAIEDDNTPVELEALGEMTAVVKQGDDTGSYYQWTAAEDGLFTVEIVSTTEGTDCDVILLNPDTRIEKKFSVDAETHEVTGIKKLAFGVSAGETILMQVVVLPGADGSIPASEVALITALEGTQENPVQVFYPGFRAEIPAGKTLYFQGYRLMDITATISGGDFTVVHAEQTYNTTEGSVAFPVVCADMFTPAVFAVTNNAPENAVCTAELAFPLGNIGNPQILDTNELAMFCVNTEEGNEQGYYLQWTAPGTGSISFQVLSMTSAGNGYDVILTSSGSYSMPMLSESEDGTVSMDVVAGDVVTIHVTVEPDAFLNYPAAEFQLQGTYSGQLQGTEETPFELTLMELPATVEAVMDIPAETDVYYSVFGAGDTCLIVEDENAYVIYNGVTYGPDNTGKVVVNIAPAMGRFPTVFQLGNHGGEAKKFTMQFVALPGSSNNPEEITSWENGVTANLKAGDPDGVYYYTWTADESGIFQVCVDSATQGVSYNVVLTNYASFVQASLTEDGVISDDITFVQLYVREGEEVAMQVTVEGAFDPNTGKVSYPEAAVSMSGYVSGSSELDLTGETESDPYYLSVEQCNIPVPAEGVVYLCGVLHGRTLTVASEDAYVIYEGITYEPDASGVITLDFPASSGVGRPMPLGFALGYRGMYDAVIPVSVQVPVGTMENPEVITDIQTAAVSLKRGNDQGYYLNWTATSNGTLTFRIGQITAGVDCDVVLSSSGSFLYPQLSESTDGTVSIDVSEGDVVRIQVLALPVENEYPAADVTLSGIFTEA